MEALECLVPAGEAPIICDPWERRLAPASPHETRYSLPVVLALRAVEGEIGLSSFERLPDERVLGFAKRITWRPMPDADFPRRFQAEIVARFADSKPETVRIDDVFGGPGDPATPDDVLAKFRANAGRAGPASAVDALEGAVLGVRDGEIGRVTAALRPFGRHPGRVAA